MIVRRRKTSGEGVEVWPEKEIFFPKSLLHGRSNYKQYYHVEREGLVTKRVDLQEAFTDNELRTLVDSYELGGRRPKDLVANPLFGEHRRLYSSTSLPPDRPFDSILDRALWNKDNKRREGENSSCRR